MSRSSNRLLGVIVGAGYVLIGILGFTVTAGVEFLATEGASLLGLFQVNPLQNIVHVVLGASLLVAGLSSARRAKTVNGAVGAFLLLLGLVGLFLVGSTANVFALTVTDNVQHFGTAVVLLAASLGADKASATA